MDQTAERNPSLTLEKMIETITREMQGDSAKDERAAAFERRLRTLFVPKESVLALLMDAAMESPHRAGVLLLTNLRIIYVYPFQLTDAGHSWSTGFAGTCLDVVTTIQIREGRLAGSREIRIATLPGGEPWVLTCTGQDQNEIDSFVDSAWRARLGAARGP